MSGKLAQRINQTWQLWKKRLGLNNILVSSPHSHKELVGLTISSDYVKVLKIIASQSNFKVENFNLIAVPSGSIIKNEIKEPIAIAKVIKKLFKQSHLTNRDIIFCIPRSMVIMKNILVNNQLTGEEIESKVWIEANRLFPNLVDDIYLDFCVTGISQQNASQLDVLVVACRKEFIKPYLEIFELADLNIKIIDINYFAYERALAQLAKQALDLKTIALLNVGFYYIDLIVMHEGSVIFTHEISYDSLNLIHAMQSNSESLPESLPEMMTGGGPLLEAPQRSNLKNILDVGLGMQIKHIMQFFYTSRPNIRLQRIILSGDCSIVIPDFLLYVQKEIGKEVILANPFKDMILASRIDKEKLARFSPALVLCCGVALRQK